MMRATLRFLLRGLILVAIIALGLMAAHYRVEGERYRGECERLKSQPVPEAVAEAPAPVEAARVRYVTREVGGGEEAASLQARIVNLERALEEKEAIIASLRQAATNRVSEPFRRGPPEMASAWNRGTNDAAFRLEIEKRREEVRQRIESAFASKATFLLNRDTSQLNEEDRKEYDLLVTLLDETWQMATQMQSDLPVDQRRELMHTLRDNLRTLDPLLMAERNREFHDIAVSLGYNETEAAQFTSYLTNIIEVTAVNSLFPQFRGGRGGGPPPGGAASRPRPTPSVQAPAAP